ncbi:MAG TPA: LytR C-terminal domain-containing protein [Acidimicrobiales bacterium]|nr:LytR C-terminal domain-containing protein [Acidimicrobiales bacterium]
MTAPENDSPPPANWIRGAGVVAVAVVVGIVLMPSATRPPIQVASASESTPTSPAGGTTTTAAGATTTTTARTTTTTAAPTVLPGASAIHVLVANGTSISGLAGGVGTYLRTRGFGTLAAANATTRVSATQVYAAAGEQRAATTVVGALGLSAGVVQPSSAVAPVASTAGATVVVIAGPDLARLAPGASTSSASSASTR